PAPRPVADHPVVATSSRNTFIEAARRAAQRQTPGRAEVAPNSLIGRALSRFQTSPAEAAPNAERPIAAKPAAKPLRTMQPEPAPAPVVATPTIEPPAGADGPVARPRPTDGFLGRNRKVILLGAAVVALAFLTMNLIVQRLAQNAAAPAPVASAPATTGDIDGDGTPAADATDPSTGMPPVVSATDPLATGAIDPSAAQGFSPSAAQQVMPSAFSPTAAATDGDDETTTSLAALDTPSSVEPLAAPVADSGPVKVDLPPEGVGPMDLRQAAADGDARAQFEVGAIYTEGRAVTQDYKLAAVWYERGAAQGFAPAEYRLGSLYENGQGVDKNLDTARLWYEKAAEAGNRMSMHNLAALYAGGQLGKQQFDSAAKWFEEAANRGLVDSQFNLGMLYARGLGVPQSLQDSFKWFGIAALSGDKDATKARDDIARSLDADTVAKLTVEVNAFKPEPIDLAANFAPIGTWSKSFDPGETITTKDIVSSVQKALQRLGYDVGTPDGVAGAKTATAIKSFEAATGMSQVGMVNPRLLAVLGSQPT
ncbi:MAG TPA: peptidoglycan-binding protein, partial [Devosia sp.]|nr:peptidoglycan-binding protein [Devosia sp.]